MGLSVPLTMPVVTLIPTFSGLPMAMTGSPTPTLPESPSVSGSSTPSDASTFMIATSVEGSSPTTSASSRTPLANLTEMSSAPPTTCWLVTIWPCSSSTNPEPPPGPASDEATSTLTTPGPVWVYTSRTGTPAAPSDPPSTGGEASLKVTSVVPSSRLITPTKIKSAVTSPPMIAATNAVSTVFRRSSFRGLRPSRLRGLCAEVVDGPPVYTPLAILLHEPPGSLVLLDLVGERGLGTPGDGRRAAGDLGGRPLDELHALHGGERAFEGGSVRESALPPILAEKLGGPVVISLGRRRVEFFHRPLGGLRLRRTAARLGLFRPLSPFRLLRRSRSGRRPRGAPCVGTASLLVLPSLRLAVVGRALSRVVGRGSVSGLFVPSPEERGGSERPDHGEHGHEGQGNQKTSPTVPTHGAHRAAGLARCRTARSRG